MFFVGITRAKNRLELSWYTNPGEPGIAGEESRYLKMIPQELLEGMPDEKERWANLQQLKKEATKLVLYMLQMQLRWLMKWMLSRKHLLIL